MIVLILHEVGRSIMGISNHVDITWPALSLNTKVTDSWISDYYYNKQ